MRHYRVLAAAAAAVALTAPMAAMTMPASAAQKTAPAVAGPRGQGPGGGKGVNDQLPPLPGPPRPPTGLPKQRNGYKPPTKRPHRRGSGGATQAVGATALPAHSASADTAAGPAAAGQPAVNPPPQAKTWGATGAATTLVVYDSTNTWGWLGELYAIGAGNLATHFGKVTAEPVVDYVSGQVNGYTATIYIGSTYNEPIPQTFLNDVLSTTKPVIWVGDNIWQLTGTSGSAADTAFEAAYGWDPATSYFDTVDTVASVSYKGQSLTRNTANTGGILAPHVTAASQVSVLASANCGTTCNGIAQTTGTSFPWAIRSSNLMYIGEVPLSYISTTDRYLAFADLLFTDLAPAATPSHEALIRLEDISPQSNTANLTAYAAYLKSQGVPFSMTVIPEYTDPKGFFNNGKALTETLAQSPTMVAALKTAVADGGTIAQHGYTHQFSNVANPFSGVSGDDFEFYRAQCSTTANSPYNFVAPCTDSDFVIEEGPVPGDSQAWAAGRVTTGRALFKTVGLPTPTLWTTPHYAASAPDYAGIGQTYPTRYDEELFFAGQLTGGGINYSRVFGQFFPYEVHDLYGATIVPENLGDYEPVAAYGNPPRLGQDIINEAQQNLAVTQGVASFFIHPDDDPMSALQQIVTGIKALGYTFVSPATLMSTNG
jgi:uncharacterized protein YdaL